MAPRSRTLARDSIRTVGNQVRVIEPAAPRPAPDGGTARGVGLLTGFAAAMVVALWVAAGTAPSNAGESELPPAALAAADAGPVRAMPDLTGLTLAEARATLVAFGVSDVELDLVATWQASRLTPPGTIVGHVPAAGRTLRSPLRVVAVVSEGGPVTSFGELPRHVREFAATLPGFEPEQPLLLIDTPGGVAYKNDDWLFGDCAALAGATVASADGSYRQECFVVETVSIRGSLIDGTRYRVSGLPAAGHPPPGPSGVIVLEGEETPVAIGITTYSPAPTPALPQVSVVGNALLVTAGPWRNTVAIYPNILVGLGPDWAETLQAAVHPRAEEGHLVIGLDPPFRWQHPGELPSRIAADYGDFRVVAGCAPDVAGVVCDPTHAISVEGAVSGFDVSGVSIRLEPTGG